jgi:hypothetical protein
MPQYRFPTKPINGLLLREQATAQGLPVERMRFSLENYATVVDVDDPPLSAEEANGLNAVIANHDAAQRTPEQQAADATAASDAADLSALVALGDRDPASLTDQEAKTVLLRLVRRELRRMRQEQPRIPIAG